MAHAFSRAKYNCIFCAFWTVRSQTSPFFITPPNTQLIGLVTTALWPDQGPLRNQKEVGAGLKETQSLQKCQISLTRLEIFMRRESLWSSPGRELSTLSRHENGHCQLEKQNETFKCRWRLYVLDAAIWELDQKHFFDRTLHIIKILELRNVQSLELWSTTSKISLLRQL